MKEFLSNTAYGAGFASSDEGINAVKLPDLANVGGYFEGNRLALLDDSAPCVFPPVVPIMIQKPTMYVNNDPEFASMLKRLMECCAVSISGIDVEYTRNTQDGPAGNDGQSIQSAGDLKISQPSPSFTFPSLPRNIVWEMMHQWDIDMGDQNTRAFGARFANPGPPILSNYSCSMAFIQFDQTYKPENILGGSIITGMFPLTYGAFGLQKEAESSMPDRSVSFAGTIRHNRKIKEYLKTLAESLDLVSIRDTADQMEWQSGATVDTEGASEALASILG